MKIIKKISAAVIALIMALSVTACGEDTAVVFSSDDVEITAGMYIAFSMSAYGSATSMEGFDTSLEDPFQNTIEGKTFEEWVLDRTKQNCAEYLATEIEFKKLGLSLSEDDLAEIDQAVESNWSYISAVYEQNSVSQATYKKIITNSFKSQMIFEAYYGKGGVTPANEDELKKYFEDNYAYVNIFGMSLETATEDEELTDEQKEANATTMADGSGYAASINEGTLTFNAAKEKYQASVDSDYEAAAKVDDDADTKVLYKKDGTSPSLSAVNSIFALEADGKAKTFVDDSAYYVAIRYPWAEDGSDYTNNYDTVLMAVKGDEYEELIQKWAEELEITTNQKAIDRYKIANLDFNTTLGS